ncbi:MAG: DUF1302 domain-containing protein, partial [Deltaproteobacteria bacterium]|nr:DUF1302 domain-containing protein [Deltaproteobacteria bacterium]
MTNVFISMLVLVAHVALATDLESIAVIGTPVKGRKEAWQGHVNFIAWLDADTLVYAGESGFIKCYSIPDQSEQ